MPIQTRGGSVLYTVEDPYALVYADLEVQGYKRKPQTTPCHADKVGLFYSGFDRGDGRENHKMQISY